MSMLCTAEGVGAFAVSLSRALVLWTGCRLDNQTIAYSDHVHIQCVNGLKCIVWLVKVCISQVMKKVQTTPNYPWWSLAGQLKKYQKSRIKQRLLKQLKKQVVNILNTSPHVFFRIITLVKKLTVSPENFPIKIERTNKSRMITNKSYTIQYLRSSINNFNTVC